MGEEVNDDRLKLRMAGPGVERNGHRKLEADGRGEPGAKRGVPLLRPTNGRPLLRAA